MAFAKGKSYVILVNMANKNPEAKKLLNDLDKIEQEEFDKRFGDLLNSKGTNTKLDETTSNPLENIKPIDSETSFAQPKPIEGNKTEPKQYKSLEQASKMLEKYKDNIEEGDWDDDREVILNELYNTITENKDGVLDYFINNKEEFKDWYIHTTGRGDRSLPLQKLMKDEYKRPKLVSKEEFKKLAQGKTMFHRGVGTKEAMTATYNSDEPYFLHQGYLGDGIYFADDFDYASTYGVPDKHKIQDSYDDANVMSFIIPDDVKLVSARTMGDLMGTLTNYIQDFTRKGDANDPKIRAIQDLDAFISRYGETYLAKLMGYDGVYEDMNMQWGQHPGKEYGSPLKTRFINLVNLEKLITYDATKEGRIDK